MDLNTVTEIVLPRTRAELSWRPGTAILGGGTWLFSEPQPAVTRLIDLAALNWPALALDETGLRIAATCPIATLSRLTVPADLPGCDLILPCCEALLGSFKIWNAATVGGNICLALPAGPMTALSVALDGIATIWTETGERQMRVVDFVRDNQRNALAPGEILRDILLPRAALQRRTARRRMSLTPLGRSGALLLATRDRDGAFALTITASTSRPVRLDFPTLPDATTLAARIETAVTAQHLWFDDIHGAPAWRRHVSLAFAEELRAELA